VVTLRLRFVQGFEFEYEYEYEYEYENRTDHYNSEVSSVSS